jgi:ferric-dicitrate binding protein FerR (iron transport regulator)
MVLTAALAHAVSAGTGGAHDQQEQKDPGDSSAPAQCVVTQDGDTHIRSVVLSHIHGQVGIDRGKGRGMEQTWQNIPVVQGMKLVTADGYAEVEFEDGTHVRLTPSTVIDFDQLALHRTGELASVIGVRLGTVYVNTAERKTSAIRLQAGGTCIYVNHATHLRLEITPARIEVAVLRGSASVEGPSGHIVAVKKSESLPFHVAEGGMATIVPGIEERPYDAWEKEAMKLYELQILHRAPPSVWH